ncbi:MAG: GDP-mannose 4,6-dehydratase [Patescibacteria group bacterium]
MNEEKKKKALITGITGQDGSYLAELLLSKGYEVHGLVRRVAYENATNRFSRIANILSQVTLHQGDVADYATIWRLISRIKPDEIYHLAAQSQVHVSFEDDFGTMKINIDSTHYILSALRDLAPECRMYFAATSEMFGEVRATPQNETTPFNPVSPYAIAKLASFYLVRLYRSAYGLHASSGILFNHESPRRGLEFVTRKITAAAARIKLGLDKELRLGNLEAKRDWGYAGDYVEAMWLMLQQPTPDDYVIGTGEEHSIREFLDEAFGVVGLDWRQYVIEDELYKRPKDVITLRADASKAKRELGWQSKKKFKELVALMMEADIQKNKEEKK